MNDRTFDRISRGLATTTSRRQALKFLGGGIAGGTLVAAGASLTGITSATAQTGGSAAVPILFESALGAFEGVFNITNFAIQQGEVVAQGTLTGTVTNALGEVVGEVSQALTLPVLADASTGVCEILDLVLGPLDLNLLGLNVFLDTVTLIITAEEGGGLLGDLLCAVANLLSGNGGALGRLRNLLNQILGALGGA